jgi:hypothetical protein
MAARRAVAHAALQAVCMTACLAATLPAQAASLQSCSEDPPLTAAQQSVLLQVSLRVKAELERRGADVALVARSGLALSWFDMRYSHGGVALRASPETPWAVRQLYFACDEQQPRLFDQGLTAFLMGTLQPELGYLSVVVLPREPARALEARALDNATALSLLGSRYSANAYAYSEVYQNCNQWLAELLAVSWSAPTPRADPPSRQQAQQWLREQAYRGAVFQLPARPFLWLTAFSPWLNRDDHPPEQLAEARFEVSMPAAIEAFVKRLHPQAERFEICHTDRRMVLRQGWTPIADGCVAAEGDEVTELR